MTIENRIKVWRAEDSGRESEGVIELLCDAEVALRARGKAVATAREVIADLLVHTDKAAEASFENRGPLDVPSRLAERALWEVAQIPEPAVDA